MSKGAVILSALIGVLIGLVIGGFIYTPMIATPNFEDCPVPPSYYQE